MRRRSGRERKREREERGGSRRGGEVVMGRSGTASTVGSSSLTRLEVQVLGQRAVGEGDEAGEGTVIDKFCFFFLVSMMILVDEEVGNGRSGEDM
nr:hypothetical protein CFP56_76866 [Quercus suber]